MTQPPSAFSGGAAPLSLGQRFIGMLTSPKATFESVVSFPRWFGMWLVTTALFWAAFATFMLSSVGHELIVTEMMKQPNAQADQVERIATFVQYGYALAAPVMSIVGTMLISGVLMGFFAITGGTASFKQVLAVVTHGGVVSTVLGVINMVLNLVRGSGTNLTSLAGIGQAFEENSFIAGFLNTVDLTTFVWLFVLSIGLAVLYRRRTQSIFITFVAVHVVISLAAGALKVAFGGS
jgi:hypothetical protein